MPGKILSGSWKLRMRKNSDGQTRTADLEIMRLTNLPLFHVTFESRRSWRCFWSLRHPKRRTIHRVKMEFGNWRSWIWWWADLRLRRCCFVSRGACIMQVAWSQSGLSPTSIQSVVVDSRAESFSSTMIHSVRTSPRTCQAWCAKGRCDSSSRAVDLSLATEMRVRNGAYSWTNHVAWRSQTL